MTIEVEGFRRRDRAVDSEERCKRQWGWGRGLVLGLQVGVTAGIRDPSLSMREELRSGRGRERAIEQRGRWRMEMVEWQGCQCQLI